jgi:RNA polymerase sigma-70 factor (ECF subfamily)
MAAGSLQTDELRRLATHHYAALLRFLTRRSRSPEDAADVAQDTFARLCQADLRQIRYPVSFLFTTAVNLLRDRARSAQAHLAAHAVPVETEELVCPAPQAEVVLDGQQRLAVLEQALSELTPKCRAVFVLFHFDGLPQRTIASRLGISVSMVEKYVKQAVDHCERHLAQLSQEGTPGGNSRS